MMEIMGSKAKNIRHVIFSFDYELYLGIKSGSVDRCVLHPTASMLNILERHHAKAVFFIDTIWLLMLKEAGTAHTPAAADFHKVAGQIRDMAKAGHYLFPHIHPHWLDAGYLEDLNQWRLYDYSKYHFHALNEEQRDKLFGGSIDLLNEIILPVLPGYKPTAYRAGGWSIEPFSDFEPWFKKYGIKYDFSKIEDCPPYCFTKNMAKDKEGGFAEFPISKVPLSTYTRLCNRVLLKYLWIKGDRGSGDGTGAIAGKMQSEALQGRREKKEQKTEMAAVELLTLARLSAYLKFLKTNTYMQFICHPKMLSQHNMKVFEFWMKYAFDTYEIETDFMKMLP